MRYNHDTSPKESCYCFECYEFDKEEFYSQQRMYEEKKKDYPSLEWIFKEIEVNTGTETKTYYFRFVIHSIGYNGWVVGSTFFKASRAYPAYETWDGWIEITNNYFLKSFSNIDDEVINNLTRDERLLDRALIDKNELLLYINEVFPIVIKGMAFKW